MACNICKGAKFGPGPGGRLSVTGMLPYCVQCGSLERHRTFREVFLTLGNDIFAGKSALQFSQDRSVDPEWFEEHEVSVYGKQNSLDLMKIDRASDRYDVVICNHVLEHVQYDNAALVELARVTKPDGFVFLTFPDPARRDSTVEWKEPRADQHYHWRIYGSDVLQRFARYVPQIYVVSHEASDPVTAASDIVYFMTKSGNTAANLIKRMNGARLAAGPERRSHG
ncbi:class I SAM-dependent methyltransferase [Sphingobium herbicidovorans]